MSFRPPLTLEQLRDIRDRRRGDADIFALLWDIRRLHGLVLRANQIQAMLPRATGDRTLELVLGEFRRLLAEEPVVVEHEKDAKELIGRREP